MSMLARLLAAATATRPPIAFIAAAQTQQSVAAAALAINKPAGTVQGDLMVAFVCASSGSDTWAGDAGWTEVADQGSQPNLRVAWKIASAGGPADYTFMSSGSGQLKSGCILSFRYAAFDVTGNIATSNSATSITIPQNNSLLLGIFTCTAIATITPPGGMATLASDTDGSMPSWLVASLAVNAGATGNKDAGGLGGAKGALLISIKPG